MSRVNEILIEALKFENDHIRRTQHILKVHSLAKLFAEKLGLDKKDLELLEIAAILHDIGIKSCKDKSVNPSLENQLIEVKMILADLSKKYEISFEEEKEIYFLIKVFHYMRKRYFLYLKLPLHLSRISHIPE